MADIDRPSHINVNKPEDLQVNKRKERPSSSSDKERDRFRRVMEKENKEKGDAKKQAPVVKKEKKSPSLFDLSAGKKGKKKGVFVAQEAELAAAKGKEQVFVRPDGNENAQLMGSMVKGQTAPTVSQSERIGEIKEIVDQIVNKIYTLNRSGESDTVITLKHPPMFDGATIKLTSYSNAKREFNLTFSNLTQEAQRLIHTNQNTLLQSLKAKEYIVHMVNATTENEQIIAAKAEEQGFRGKQEEREQQQKQQQKKEQDDEQQA